MIPAVNSNGFSSVVNPFVVQDVHGHFATTHSRSGHSHGYNPLRMVNGVSYIQAYQPLTLTY